MSVKNPIIVALDTHSQMKALALVSKLKVTGVAFKVGLELFCAYGPKIVEKILNHEVRVFLDLKFHDIPNTVERAARRAARMGVWMFNVHASGGVEMMRRAKEASSEMASKKKREAPLVLGVTVLTSTRDLSELNIPQKVSDQVLHLARLSKKAGLDGVVASGEEAGILRKEFGKDFTLVTPGIRMEPVEGDDQKRVQTPEGAIRSGSDYLVIGRPITESLRPMKAVDQILNSLV